MMDRIFYPGEPELLQELQEQLPWDSPLREIFRAALAGLGFPELSFPELCFPELSFPETGFSEVCFPEPGFPELGFPELGFSEPGFPELGFSAFPSCEDRH